MYFYVLDHDVLSEAHATDIFGISQQHGITPRCPICKGLIGMMPWLPPYQIEIKRRGREFGDIVKGIGMDLFLTDKFRYAWDESKLKGLISFDAVEIISVTPQRASSSVPVYWHAIVNRGSAAVDMERSTFSYFINEPPTCKYCGGGFDAVAGFEIDETTWNGDDIFIPRNMPGTIVVTQRFVDMITKYHLTHAILIPTEKYIFDPLHLIVPYSKHKN